MGAAGGRRTEQGDDPGDDHVGSALHRAPAPGVLPPAESMLVLYTCDDAGVAARLDAVAAATATALDLRSGAAWAEVPDGRHFLRTLVRSFDQDLHRIRLAFGPPDASLDVLVGRAMGSRRLSELADLLDQADLADDPPVYQVRFQPLVELSSRAVIGYESLIRASVAGAGIDADRLLERAERGGWLADLDQLGRTLALRSVGHWLGDGLLFLNVLAPGGVVDVEAVRSTVTLAGEFGIEPDQLVLELTERNRYHDLGAAATQIAELRSLGVRIAVDDVGDGYASLLLVSHFRPDVVKIAGHIVAALPSREAEAVIAAVVALAHGNRTWVVAESIETGEQARRLARLGVDWGQGHFLGLPEVSIGSPLTASRPLLDRS